MITSNHNPKIQWVRALQTRPQVRREERAFVVEGVRLAEEALVSGWNARLVLHTEGLTERSFRIVTGFADNGVAVELVSPQVMATVAETQTPQGILVVLTNPSVSLPPDLDFVLIADEVRDPGNLGTMLRTAAAADVGGVFLPAGAVDPFSPKVVRAAMGAHFRLPILTMTWEEIVPLLRAAHLRLFLASAGEGTAYDRVDLRQPLALIVGGEAQGAGSVAMNIADERIHIPMPGGIESLNVAIATGILLFEGVRQRSRM